MRLKDFHAYFKETENDTELFASLSWDENKKFLTGEKNLPDFEGQYARYLVELENGKNYVFLDRNSERAKEAYAT